MRIAWGVKVKAFGVRVDPECVRCLCWPGAIGIMGEAPWGTARATQGAECKCCCERVGACGGEKLLEAPGVEVVVPQFSSVRMLRVSQ
jgi:hypothetical protein